MKKPGPDFARRYGPWSLVIGAAEGLGAAFAEALAEVGLNLVLVDRQSEKLADTADRLRRAYGHEVREAVVDLTEDDFLVQISGATQGLEIGLLICNAALGEVGPFEDSDLASLLAIVDVNVKAPLALTHTYGRAMVQRGRGGIIVLASNSAYHGTPYVAHYAATKAYNLVLGEGLWFEWARYGVDVMAFAPGATNTPGLRRAKPGLIAGRKSRGVMQPEDSARAALAALGKVPSARPGVLETLQTFFLTRILGRHRAVRVAGAYIRKNLESTKT
ncbi:MAG: SDR family NAD(P)-dependent oxidoreductase [Deltaproteobacteria bacterium]